MPRCESAALAALFALVLVLAAAADGRDPLKGPAARVEGNATAPPLGRKEARPSGGVPYADMGQEEQQKFNKAMDVMRQLYSLNNNQRQWSDNAVAGMECSFEEDCTWTWRTDVPDGFVVLAADAEEARRLNITADAGNNTEGHFLFLRGGNTRQMDIVSPNFEETTEARCTLDLWVHQAGRVAVKVVSVQAKPLYIGEIPRSPPNRWHKFNFTIGTISQQFKLTIEVIPMEKMPYVALDNIRLTNCFPEPQGLNVCSNPYQFQCESTNECVNNTEICDITFDCINGEDEKDCEMLPKGSRCDFEEDECKWYNKDKENLQWVRHNGPTPTNRTGPNFDHTYRNATGHFMYVNMASRRDFASAAFFNSPVFNPPPPVVKNESSKYYNSCTIRFSFHQHCLHKSGLGLSVIEIKPTENVTTSLFWNYGDMGDKWHRRILILPNITNKYYLIFEAKKGMRFIGDIAIDDISLSPQCFGLNIPATDLNGYDYYNPMLPSEVPEKETHKYFRNLSFYEFTTCGTKGREGPSHDNCTRAYNNTSTKVIVIENEPELIGVQKWKVPAEGYYTVIAVGASGGRGSGGIGSSRGALVRTVMELKKDQELYILVGQEGSPAAIKSLSKSGSAFNEGRNIETNPVRQVYNTEINDGGGGGGGGTFVFLRNRAKVPIPLVVAGGGGGLPFGYKRETAAQHGQGIDPSKEPFSGFQRTTAGAGGGWMSNKMLRKTSKYSGSDLMGGGRGGFPCYTPEVDYIGEGGFGGGGGGCTSGGGGGGYTGGNSTGGSGDGGFSYISTHRTLSIFNMVLEAQNSGPGYVLIIPSITGTACSFRCAALDIRRSQVTCICPGGSKLADDLRTCLSMGDDSQSSTIMLIAALLAVVIILIISVGFISIMLYNRYLQRTSRTLRQKILSGPDFQLNRLRVASDSMMTEYNPNYEFGGVVCTVKDLKDIPREQLRLVKALGQGAFGEVYQGFYRQRSGDAIEMPVAVKTLPELSTNQAELDFLMEALIMSKFSHPNIVHLIGVCLDKHPRFIVLELLAGGDLKNFLREVRPKPERASTLTMKDLVFIAIDVAKGCKYLEDNRFIHRDIAARNCLLTTKGPGRVVKIADFGMSRDIYRSDYYRKGGKAMLPIKWMPPEAFLDGIFTSKTDVWSFGVLLWEIMSLGYMPYTGCSNRDVMQLVTSGGRLEPPANCPGPIYGIMTQCWHPEPEKRLSFALILERLGYCSQDPQVMNAPMPVFNRLPSNERDTTVMRPEVSDQSYLKVPPAADYLIPTPNHNHHRPEHQNSLSTSSVGKLLTNDSDNWETSFVMPHSKSTQPLLQDSEASNTSNIDKVVKNGEAKGRQQQQEQSTQQTVVNANHNNNAKVDGTSKTDNNGKTDNHIKVDSNNIKKGVSLDASLLAKQANEKKPYMNVGSTSGQQQPVQNGPSSVYMNSTSKYKNADSEINC